MSAEPAGSEGLAGKGPTLVARNLRRARWARLAARALVGDHGAEQVDVAPGAGDQGAAGVGDVEAGDAVDTRAADQASRGLGGGLDVDVAARRDRQRVSRIDGAADVVQVRPGLQADAAAGDSAPEVVDRVGVDRDQRAPGDGAGVDEVARALDDGGIATAASLLS